MPPRKSTETDLVTPCVSLLNSLALHTVDQTWVDSIWDGQFTETQELPMHYEEVIQGIDVRKVLVRLQELTIEWIKVHGQEDTSRVEEEGNTSQVSTSFYRAGFWTLMTEQNIKYKVLVALLYHYMERGMEMASGEQERNLAIQAAGLYLVLLGIPGSGAFKIFHPVLYSKALDIFTLVNKLGLDKRSPKKKGGAKKTSQSQASQRRGGGSQSQHDGDENDDEESVAALSQREVGKVVQGLVEVLNCLHIMLDNCSLKRSFESIEATVVSLVNLTHLETTFSVLDLGSNRRDRASDVSSLAVNAYLGLAKLCSPLHGEGAGGVHAVLKGLLPGVLLVGEGPTKGLGVIRAHTLRFVRFLMVGGGQPVCKAVCVLVQHMAVKVPDKAEFRREAAEAIVNLMQALPRDMFSSTVRWFVRYAHSEKSSNRLFSLEVVGRLMYTAQTVESEDTTPDDSTIHPPPRTEESASSVDPSSEPNTPSSPPGSSTPNPANLPATSPPQSISDSFLFACIYGRCADISASVRAQALKTLGEITGEQAQGVKKVLDTIFSPDKASRGQLSLTEVLEDPDLDLSSVDFLPSGDELIQFLRRRALDQSVFVRKSALQVLENILKTSDSLMAEDLVSVMAEHCRDSSLAVRKQMVISLTELVKTYPDKETLVSTWVQGVFPLILDVEAKASEKVLECIWDCLFGNLVPAKKMSTIRHALPWLILTAVENNHMANYLARACNTWAKEAKINNTVLNTLQSYIGTERNGPAWMLLGLISAHVPCKDPHMVMEYFNTSINTPEGVGLYTLLQVLKVLFASVSRLSEADRASLQENLLTLVQRFKIPPELISIAIDVITVVSSLQVPKDNMKLYQSAIDGWAVPILEDIDTNISTVLLKPTAPDCPVEEEKLSRQIFTLGELCQICPHRTNKRMFLLMQSIVFQTGVPSTSQTESNIPVLPTSQTQSTQPPAMQFTPTTKLQSLTVVTLGKMCLQNEGQAKKIIPAFGQILDTSNDPSIKNNIMYALTDMCVRYASLVDPLLPQMTACLRDKSLSVRRTTLILLIHLLQEDYLKIRGNGKFLFRLIQTLQDSSEEIRHLTTFYIQQRLLKRIPKIMYSHFVESLFHFNDYQDHASYNKFIVSAKEKRMFNLSGEKNIDKRRALYRFMLENMNDEQRFQTTYRLCQDILGGVVEGAVSLSPASMPLLQDTFYCLASDSIKLASLKSKGGDEEAETEQDMAGKVLEAAKKTIISGVVKKNVMENIIPIIIALKHKLESAKSPLVSDIFKYLRKLMEDYKNEVNDILAADKQLAKEIEFDLRRYEQEQQEIKEREEQERLAREQRQNNQSSANLASVPGSPRSPATGTPRSTSGTPRSPASGTPRSPASGTPRSAGSPRGASAPNTPKGSTRPRPELLRQALHNAVTQSSKKGTKATSKLMESFKAANIEAAEKSTNADDSSKNTVHGASESTRQTGKDITNKSTTVQPEGANENTESNDHANKSTSETRSKIDGENVVANAEPNILSTNDEGNQVRENTDPGSEDNGGDGLEKTVQEKEDDCDEGYKEGENVKANEEFQRPGPVIEAQTNSDNEGGALNPEEGIPASDDEQQVEKVGQEVTNDHDKSKRVSGQGMERQKHIKTPRTRRIHNVRAISTPQVNKTVLGDNVTFMGESESVLDLSAITVLSPPSVVSDPDSRRGSTSARNKDDTDAVSFRFRKGGKDMFQELVDVGEGAVGGKRKSEEGRVEDRKRLTGGGRKRGSAASLDVIHEEGKNKSKSK